MLKDSLGTSEAKNLRLTPCLNKIIHALSKAVGEGRDRYGKGFGHHLRAFLIANHPSALYLTLGRTDKGTRQDACTNAAWVVAHNLELLVEFLHDETIAPTNVLKQNLLVTLSSKPVVGAFLARAIVHDKFTRPFCFFAASNELEGWSPLDMAGVLERTRAFFVACRDTPEVVATAQYEAFDTTIPAYAKFRQRELASTKSSVDGKTQIADIAPGRVTLTLNFDS